MKRVSILIIVITVLCWTLIGKTFAEMPETDDDEEENEEDDEMDEDLNGE